MHGGGRAPVAARNRCRMRDSGGGEVPGRGKKYASYPIRAEQPTVFGEKYFYKVVAARSVPHSGSTLKACSGRMESRYGERRSEGRCGTTEAIHHAGSDENAE